MGENEYGKSGHLYIFISLKHFVSITALFLHPITETDSM